MFDVVNVMIQKVWILMDLFTASKKRGFSGILSLYRSLSPQTAQSVDIKLNLSSYSIITITVII